MEIYKLVVDLNDDTGLTFNALVDRPAHNKSLMAFDKERQYIAFDDTKRMVTGVAISANQLMYRRDPHFGEYYVYFAPLEIEKMVLKMSRKQLLSSVNLMHDDKRVVKGMTFIEGYFVSDSKRPPNDTENVQNGSYVMTYYIEDQKIYNEIKAGKYVGYSVEGLFDQVKINYKQKKQEMKKKNLFEMVFGSQHKFAEVTTSDGIVLFYDGELASGTPVFIMDAEGNQIASPEAVYTLEDGTTITVDANGVVTEVKEVEILNDEAVTIEEVFSVLKKLNEKISAVEAQFLASQEAFETFKKELVPAEKKFDRIEKKTWKDL